MIKNSVLLILSISISLLPAILVEEDSFQGFLYNQAASCEYDNWISHIAEGIADEGYNVYAPYDRQTNGFGDFYEPDEMETAQWEIVLTFFNNENYDDTDFYLDYYGIPYQVVEFQDTDTGRTYYLLREYPNYEYYDDNGTPDITADDENGAFDYGWGLFVYNPSSPLPVIITAPHPNDDYLTSAMACHCFQEWNARYLLIAGAGREVKWTENGTYSNSKSLSDPSRNEDHPFNIPYNYFCDRIRADWGCREFSAQIHSYDWNRHDGYANCQISAGYSKGCPNLPIRDLSDLKIDIINASNHLMLPANTVGNNQPVYLNDYYAVNYNLYEFTFSDGDTTYAVNNDVDLPGYSQNQQMLYSFQNWNRYDVFEPFFHIEMDELPESYAQTEENWKWFYAYDPDSGTFDMDNLFTLVLQYYNGWTAALLSVLPTVFELDDSLIPAEPQNFTFLAQGYDTISLGWEFISSFDFNTYEILYTTGSDIPTEYTVIDRVDYSILASQRANMVTVQNLSGNQHYFFRLQAVDYNNNYSLASPEI
ncbi:MAG: hypothetical protein JXB60_07845, partial [Candidatus Cloacimonetes bacterium]|nr:hypothetical protein [Candidatus Cloacimonadota bacterium]